MSESNRRRLFELLKESGNNICADCECEGPEWASITLGVFLCTQCASIHRKIGSHISRIKSLKLDNWDQTNLIVMEENGNVKSKNIYEKNLPHYYRRPQSDDPHVVREQWIRAKYERKEFVKQVNATYSNGHMEGFLWKRGKEDGKFQLRKFVLSESEGTIKYYVKQTQKHPKSTINIVHLNMTFCPTKIANPNGLQLSWLNDKGFTRNIFIYSECGKDIIDWYTAIRAAKFRHLQIAFPETPKEDLKKFLSRDFIKEGYLWKTGPRVTDSYKKRWFVLDDRKLMYLEHKLDAYPKGEMFLGEVDEGYSIRIGVPSGMKELEQGYSFTLVTPERTWLFGTETVEERQSWINAIESVIEKPPAPQNYNESLRCNLRNSRNDRKSRGSNVIKNLFNL